MARTRRGDYPIPFDPDGTPLSYTTVTAGVSGPHVKWRKNHEFDAEMTYVGFSRGRSAAHLLWQDGRGVRYTMFLADADALFKTRTVAAGVVAGRWTFCKRGSNYGVRPVAPTGGRP